jgi:hypothetical protein
MRGKEDRVVTNVDMKSFGGPAADGLNVIEGDAITSKSSGAAGAQRLASDLTREMTMEVTEKPGSEGNGSILAEPELWVEGEEEVARREVGLERRDGVVTVRETTEEYGVAFK